MRRCHGPSATIFPVAPARVAGAYVVLVGEVPVLYVERGSRGLVTLAGRPARGGASGASSGGDPDPLYAALAALAEAVRGGKVQKLSLERIDGEPVAASTLVETLIELGFQPGPRRLTLSA